MLPDKLNPLERQLLDALNAMLVGTDKTAPEFFPGHTEAYLRTVAIPRAMEAKAAAEIAARGIRHNRPFHPQTDTPPLPISDALDDRVTRAVNGE